ncbi:tumor necrosis factor receptor superfamily member 8 [Pleurodeles waltl]|uniref:tumor necrosis factor receptor superfamily member 8 n=1 Tax=Pleurodeles waltl TaxID=8319 RepID=UPI003709656A
MGHVFNIKQENQQIQGEYHQEVMQQLQALNTTMASIAGVLNDMANIMQEYTAHQQLYLPSSSSLASLDGHRVVQHLEDFQSGSMAAADSSVSLERTCHLQKVEVGPGIRQQQSFQDLRESKSLIEASEVHSSWALDQADLDESDDILQEETRGAEQTNNRIEAIYIMQADTVIVGSVSEAPRSQSANLRRSMSCETLYHPHYPLQESDPPRTAKVTLSVEEEEGKSSPEPSQA